MTFESKYFNKKPKEVKVDGRKKVKAILTIDNGKPEISFRVVPKFTLKLDDIDEAPIMGTEIFFEGRLFYPVVWAQKGPQGWCVTKPDFMLQNDMFFFNPHLKKEETELDIQGFLKTVDSINWKYYMEELNNQAFQALKIAFSDYIKRN